MADIIEKEMDEAIVKGVDFQIDSVTVSYGKTINLGNFESVRIDKSVTLRSNVKATDKATFIKIRKAMYKEATAIVDREIERETK